MLAVAGVRGIFFDLREIVDFFMHGVGRFSNNHPKAYLLFQGLRLEKEKRNHCLNVVGDSTIIIRAMIKKGQVDHMLDSILIKVKHEASECNVKLQSYGK
jgi:hypothetical protein